MKTTEKRYKITLDPEKSAKEVHKALMEPIRTLTKILKEKLKGAGKHFHIKGPINVEIKGRIDIKDMNTNMHHFINDFPGYCHIQSINGSRFIDVSIRFYRWKNNDPPTLMFDIHGDFGERMNYYHIEIKRLDDPEFINGIRDYLKNKKEFHELPWIKWEI